MLTEREMGELLAWIKNPQRKEAVMSFTEGDARQIAYAVTLALFEQQSRLKQHYEELHKAATELRRRASAIMALVRRLVGGLDAVSGPMDVNVPALLHTVQGITVTHATKEDGVEACRVLQSLHMRLDDYDKAVLAYCSQVLR